MRSKLFKIFLLLFVPTCIFLYGCGTTVKETGIVKDQDILSKYDVKITSIKMKYSELTIKPGTQVSQNVLGSGFDVTQKVTWTIADPSVATISIAGVVRAIATGNTVATATYSLDQKLIATCNISVIAGYNIVFPNGTESLMKGSTYNITWRSGNSPDSKVSIGLYIANQNSCYKTIASYIVNSGKYAWRITNDIPTNNLYKIQIVNYSDSTEYAYSDSYFNIINNPNSIAYVIVSPNPTGDLVRGQTYQVNWNCPFTPNHPLRIYLYRDDQQIAWFGDNVTNTGSASVQIPTSIYTGSHYRIRISDSYNLQDCYESSDYNIVTAVGLTPLRVVSPNGGEDYSRGQTYEIKWDSSQGIDSRVTIYLYNGNTNVANIASYILNTGSYQWTIPSNIPADKNYKIRIYDNNNSEYDLSDGTFTINRAAGQLPIQLTYPNGTEQLTRGQDYNINWDYPNMPNAYVNIYLLKNSYSVDNNYYYNQIAYRVPNTGTYTWHIPSNFVASNDYKIKVVDYDINQEVDYSDNLFSIVKADTQLPLTMTSPNGGEILTRGQAYPINWSYPDNPDARISIVLYKNGSQFKTIDSYLNNTGSYTWTIPSNFPISDYYRLQVVDTNSNNGESDYSDNNFRVIKAAGQEPLTLLSPNGGETISRGEAYVIRWSNPKNPDARINIGYSKNGDAYYSSFVSGVQNTGEYTWIVPDSLEVGNIYKIKVSDAYYNEDFDISASCFSIAKESFVPVDIAITTTVSHSNYELNPVGDKDYYKFHADQGSRYDFYAISNMTMYAAILDSNTNMNDNYYFGNEWNKVYWTAPSSGDYYLRIKPYNDTVTGSYELYYSKE